MVSTSILSCSICLNTTAPPYSWQVTQCGHIFHKSCLASSLASRAGNSKVCPNCRHDIKGKNGIHDAYPEFEVLDDNDALKRIEAELRGAANNPPAGPDPEVMDMRAQIETLEREAAHLQAERAELAVLLQHKSADAEALRSQAREERQQAREASLKLSEAQREHSDTRRRLKAAEAEAQRLSIEVQRYRLTVERPISEEELSRIQLPEQYKQAYLFDRLGKMNEDNKRLAGLCDALGLAKDRAETEAKRAEVEAGRMRKRVEDLEARLAQAERRAASLESQPGPSGRPQAAPTSTSLGKRAASARGGGGGEQPAVSSPQRSAAPQPPAPVALPPAPAPAPAAPVAPLPPRPMLAMRAPQLGPSLAKTAEAQRQVKKTGRPVTLQHGYVSLSTVDGAGRGGAGRATAGLQQGPPPPFPTHAAAAAALQPAPPMASPYPAPALPIGGPLARFLRDTTNMDQQRGPPPKTSAPKPVAKKQRTLVEMRPAAAAQGPGTDSGSAAASASAARPFPVLPSPPEFNIYGAGAGVDEDDDDIIVVMEDDASGGRGGGGGKRLHPAAAPAVYGGTGQRQGQAATDDLLERLLMDLG